MHRHHEVNIPPTVHRSPGIVGMGARILFLLVSAISLVYLPTLVDDHGLQSLLPLLVLLTFLEFAPAFLPGRPDLFAPPVFAGVITGMGTVGMIAFFVSKGEVELGLVEGLNPAEAADLAIKITTAMCVGQVCYYVGFYHPRWSTVLSSVFPRVQQLTWSPRRMRVAIGACALVFIVSYAAFQVRLGGSLFDVTRLSEGKSVLRNDPSASWMMRGIQVGFLPAFLLITYLARRRLSTLLPFLLVPLLLALLVLRMGQRGIVAYAFLSGLIIIHYLRRRIPVILFAVILFMGTTVSQWLLPYREKYLRRSDDANVVELAQKPGTVLADSEAERQRFGALAVVFYNFPDNEEYLLGKSWLALATMLVPRWIWHEKAEHYEWRDSNIVKRLAGAPIPTGYLGALYANFSWMGIVLGMTFWGALQAGLYAWLRRSQDDPNVVLLYAMFLLYFGLTMLHISNAIQYVIPTWLIIRTMCRPRVPIANAVAAK